MDYQVTENVLPYFSGINHAFDTMGSDYRIGIYAPRNVCIRAADNGYTCSSFVCDMSTGFSGNLGYPLPRDWAFDQIKTVDLGSGSGFIKVDNNIAKGTYYGETTGAPSQLDLFKNIKNTSLYKALGVDVPGFGKKTTVFNSPLIKIEGKTEFGFKKDGDLATLKINPDGTLDGIGLSLGLKAIKTFIGKEKLLH